MFGTCLRKATAEISVAVQGLLLTCKFSHIEFLRLQGAYNWHLERQYQIKNLQRGPEETYQSFGNFLELEQLHMASTGVFDVNGLVMGYSLRLGGGNVLCTKHGAGIKFSVTLDPASKVSVESFLRHIKFLKSKTFSIFKAGSWTIAKMNKAEMNAGSR